jgi:ADP-heptose:LPS heptosyltransferase
MKILIIRFSSIGDIVLTTPVVRCLKLQFPEIEIHYLTKKPFSLLLEDNPYIDKLHLLDKDENSLILALKNERFNQIIDLHNNLRTLKFRLRLGVDAFTVNKLNFEKWAKVVFKWDALPELHIVDRYIETVKHIGVENDGQGLDFFIHPNHQVDLSQYMDSANQGFNVFAIGATYFTKRIPFDKLLKLAQDSRLPVFFIGGKEDAEIGEQLASQTSGSINLCGKLNLQQSASVISQASAVITGDTGMMHIAAAFNKRTISLWGNTIPEFGMYPYMPKNPEKSIIFEDKELHCRPCSKLGYASCPKKHFGCMNNLDNAEILNQLNKL